MKHLLYILAIAGLVLAACKRNHDETVLPLAVNGFLPNSGNPGTVVTIRGTGFSSGIDGNTVAFNGAAARVMSANDTVLIVQAPEKGSTGPLTVTTGSRSITAPVYTYQALSVHGISPVNGPEGTNIYISGAGFSSLAGPATVTINGKTAIVSNSNDTLLTAIVPAGAGSGAVEVSVNNTHATGPEFIFQSIAAIKPSKGGEGTLVTITGTGFSTTAANNIVAFNGQVAKVLSATTTAVQVIVPAQVKAGPVSVTVNGQKTAGPVFTPVPAPVIKSVAPLSGPVGATVVINGDNFSEIMDEDTVSVNGKTVTLVSATATQLVVTIPQGTTSGNLKVSVNGQVATGPVYTVQSLGISRLLPDNGLEGSVITVKGTGFDKIAANNRVTINGLSVAVNEATDSTLVVTIPVGVTTGTLNVSTGSLSAVGPVFRRAGVSLFYKGSMSPRSVRGMAFDSKGNLFTAGGGFIGKITPDGNGTLFAGGDEIGNVDGTGTNARFWVISGMAIDAQDNLYVCDVVNSNIRKITPSGKVTTLYSNLSFQPKYLTYDGAGNLYAGSDYNGVFKLATDGSLITQASRVGLQAPFGLYNNYLFTGSQDGQTINRIDMVTGQGALFIGAYNQGDFIDGPKGVGRVNGPSAMKYDPVSGLIYLIEVYNYSIRSFNPIDGMLSTVTGSGGTYEPWHSGNKNGTLQEALLSPTSNSTLVTDKNGNIYLFEENLEQIRKITLK